MAKYKVRVAIVSQTEELPNMTEEQIVRSVGNLYEDILTKLKIPYLFVEVEIQPVLHVVTKNNHKNDLTNDN